jgi:hypothetical protein
MGRRQRRLSVQQEVVDEAARGQHTEHQGEIGDLTQSVLVPTGCVPDCSPSAHLVIRDLVPCRILDLSRHPHVKGFRPPRRPALAGGEPVAHSP